MGINPARLSELLTPRFYLTVLSVLFVAYVAEIGSPTFSNDYFYDVSSVNWPYYAYVYDGRYFSELLRHLMGGLYPPTFVLMLGLACLVGCGLAVSLLFEIRNWSTAALICSLFATCPILFEVFSYPSIRLFVPLAALFSLLAMLTPSTLLGVLFVFLAMNLYQSAVYLAVVTTLYASAVQLQTASLGQVLRTFALPRAARVLAGMLLYGLVLYIVAGYFQFGGGATRLANFAKIATTSDQLLQTGWLLLRATAELYTRDAFLFPAFAKYVFAAVTVLLMLAMVRRRNPLGLILVMLAPLTIFGTAWIMFPAQHMLNDRILFAFAGIYAGTVAAAWLAVPRLRPIVAVAGWVVVATFVYQANVWHQYMDLRNRADMDIARSISDRIKSLPEFQRGMPLVVVGTLQDRNYLPFRAFDSGRGIIGNSMLASMHSMKWSADRAILFFVDYGGADPATHKIAEAEAQTMPIWPAEGSVAIRQGIVVARLK